MKRVETQKRMRRKRVDVGAIDGTDTAWLTRLKAGDAVIVCSHYGDRIVRVTRTTPTRLVIIDGATQIPYSRKNGWKIGATVFQGSFLKPYTDEDGKRVRLRQAQNTVYAFCRRSIKARFAALTMEQCAEVLACLRRVGLIDKGTPG